MTVEVKILGAEVGLGGIPRRGGERGSGRDKWPPQCGVEAMGEATVRKSPWLLCPLMHRALLIPFRDDVILRILRAPVILFSANVLHPQFSRLPPRLHWQVDEREWFE